MYIIGVKLVLSKQSRLPGRLLFSELVETGKLQTGSKSREKICAKNTNFTHAKKASIMQNSYRGDSLEHGQGRTLESTFELGNSLFFRLNFEKFQVFSFLPKVAIFE